MKLIDLEPRYYSHGGEGIYSAKTGEPIPERKEIGILFNCPCGCEVTCAIPFTNPPDGKPVAGKVTWYRTGDSFDNLTLTPSIQRIGGCAWHGFITNGEIKTV